MEEESSNTMPMQEVKGHIIKIKNVSGQELGLWGCSE